MLRRQMLSVIIAILVLTGCSSDKDYPIAKVGGISLYKSQFDKVFVPMKGVSDEENSAKAKTALDNTLKQMASYQYMKSNNELPQQLKNMEIQSYNQKLLESVYTSDVINKVKISDKQLFENYKRMNTTVWAQHILVEDKKLADSIYGVLKKEPKKFEELAALYSTDTNTKNNGGNLKPFSGGAMIKEFENACFSQTKNVIGAPVKSHFGYHIIRVLNRETKDLTNFATEKQMLEANIKKKLIQERAALSEKELRAMGKVKINPEALEGVITKLMTDSLGNVVFSPDATDKDKKTVVATSMFGSWTMNDVLVNAEKNGFGKFVYSNLKNSTDFIDRMVFFMTIYEKGRRMGVPLRSDFKKDIQLKMAIYTYGQVMKDIRTSVEVTDEELNEYYNTNINSFMDKGRVGLYVLCNEDSVKVASIMDSLKANKKKPFKEYCRLYSTLKPKEFSKPDYYLFADDDTTGYYSAGSPVKVNGYSPLFKNVHGFNIVQVAENIQPKPKELTDEFKNGYLKNEYLKFVSDSIFNEEYKKAEESMKITVYQDKYEKAVTESIEKNKEKK